MVVAKEQDHYKILGVKKGCDDSEVKKSYYKLAKKWHPDKNGSPLAEEKFKEINKAYEILSDDKKRGTYDLTYTADRSDILTRTSTSFSAKTRSTYTPKSANFTFFTNTSTANDYNMSYDAKWHEFTKANNFYDPTRATENPFPNANPKYTKPDIPPPMPPPKFTPPKFNAKFNRESFYRGFKKYFDADYYSTDTDDDSDSVIIEDFYNELSNKAKKAKGDGSRNRNSSAPKWKKTWEEMNKKSSPRPNTDNPTKSPPEEIPKNGFKRDNPIFNGFKFNSKSDPFELLETFAMYKLFSEMSHRLFKDVDDDEMLIKLAKIISSFNLPPKNKMNTSPMNSFRKQNSGETPQSPPPPPPKTPNSPRQKSEETEKKNSDFVFSETIRRKREEENARYRSERSRSNTTPSPTTKASNNSWEFEWMGKRNGSTKSSDSPTTTQQSSRTDSGEDSFDEKYSSNSENNDSFSANYKKYEENAFNTSKSCFECQYCYKRLTDKEDLMSHQAICKRLAESRLKNKYYSSKMGSQDFYPARDYSPNSTTTTSMTECVKCKVRMSTYDYLMHQCESNARAATADPEPRANLNSATSNLSTSSSFKYAYRNKPTIDTGRLNSRRSFDSTKPASAINRSTTYTPSSTSSPRTTIPTAHSDFVFSKLRTPLSASKKQYPDMATSPKCLYTSASSPKRSVQDTENNKPVIKSSLASVYGNNAIKKSTPINGVSTSASTYNANSTYGGLDTQYTPSTYRPLMSQQSFSSATYSPKPYSSFKSPGYSKSSKLISNASFSGVGSNKYYPFNAYTGLKREKLRTGF